jgi:ribosomal protein S16
MRTHWLVVANAARARVLEQTDEVGVFEPVADLVHPQSRMKGERLGSDRIGHARAQGGGLAGTSFLPHSDPRERQHDDLARRIAAP